MTNTKSPEKPIVLSLRITRRMQVQLYRMASVCKPIAKVSDLARMLLEEAIASRSNG
jgi:hypothetical protein